MPEEGPITLRESHVARPGGLVHFPKTFAYKGLCLRVFPEKNVFVKGIPCGQKRSGIMDFAKSVARKRGQP